MILGNKRLLDFAHVFTCFQWIAWEKKLENWNAKIFIIIWMLNEKNGSIICLSRIWIWRKCDRLFDFSPIMIASVLRPSCTCTSHSFILDKCHLSLYQWDSHLIGHLDFVEDIKQIEHSQIKLISTRNNGSRSSE